MIREDKSLDLPFYLYWANESWRKSWFGQDNHIVWEQKYGTEKDWKEQFDYCLTYFKDDRYIKIDNKPVYAIFNAWAIPEQKKFVTCWNKWAREEGFSGIYFVRTMKRHESGENKNFSAKVTREPTYSFVFGENLFEKAERIGKTQVIDFINRKFLLKHGRGIVMMKAPYDLLWQRILKRKDVGKDTFLGCFCDWDNSPRKSYNSTIMQGVTADKFKHYFKLLYRKAQNNGCPMIVINAWNEWAEGAYLEPDTKNGYAMLEAIRDAKRERGVRKETEK